MIQEEYVQFETAKLLKKAGFPQDDHAKASDHDGWMFAHGYECDGEFFTTPTQAQAMRWLREIKNIAIEPRPSWPYEGESKRVIMKWCVVVLRLLEHPTVEEQAKIINTLVYFPTYESAAEAGIQAACKYLIERGGEL